MWKVPFYFYKIGYCDFGDEVHRRTKISSNSASLIRVPVVLNDGFFNAFKPIHTNE